jgi:hypothetical protein
MLLKIAMRPPQRQQPRSFEQLAMSFGALIGITGIALQFYYMLQVPDISRIEAVVRFFSFFTILTNLLVTFGYCFPLLLPESRSGRWFAGASARGATLVYIVVVGAVYNLLLRQLYHPVGWAKVADVLVHDAAPIFYIIFWVAFAAKSGLRWMDAAHWLLYPLAYLAYTLARGAIVHFYPYPFVDVMALGYLRVLVNAAGLTVLFWVLGLIVVMIARITTAMVAQTSQPDLI